jgi:tetratricopeptide (TPR) repeat protein
MVLSIAGLLFAFSFLLLGKRPEPFVEETIKFKFETKALLPLILILPVFISWFFYYREVIGMMNSRWNTVMAATLLSRGEEESALSHLKEALSSKYVYPEAYLKMGLFLSQKKSYADAIFYLLKALSYYPSLPILYRSLSEASFYAGDINSSIDFAKTYYEMERSHESAVWFAIILLKSGRSRDAFNFLRSVKKYYYDSPIILILYGLANMAMGNTQDALFFWQKGFYLLKDLPPDFIKEIKTLLGTLPPQYREQKEELLKMFENK